jgi:hypothetical protein
MCKKKTRILLDLFKILQSFSIDPKYESVGEILAPRLLRAMSEVARWQDQEGELKFQHNNSSSKNGKENR